MKLSSSVLPFLALILAACSVNTAPENGKQRCAVDTEKQCPSGYYCGSDSFCWKEGTGPDNDAGAKKDASEVDEKKDAGEGNQSEVGEDDVGNGLQNVANGDSCSSQKDCSSGFCVGGICCSSACDGVCMACNVVGKMGTCSPVPSGDLPIRADQCTKESLDTCGLDGTCDGTGACRRYPDGTVCVAGTCSATAASVVGIKKCQAGKCEPGGSEICTPFGCDASKNECFGSCTGDNQCAANQSCKSGSCGKKPQGARCGKADECESNFCADGVCCGQACEGACVTCNSVGSPGECVPVADGRPDPRGVCKDEGGASCGKSGACNGKGSCALYASGTTCASSSCLGNSAVPASTCNGNGSCVQPAAVSCGSFKCTAGVCPKDCATANDCVSPNACTSGSCGLKEAGQKCDGNAECRTGVCADGVCCDKACGGACQACNLASSLGKCTSVGAGQSDPHGVCTAAKKDSSTCDENGFCDGSGGCQRYAAGTPCSAEVCSMDKSTPASTCDGSGECIAKAALMCSPYKCNGTKCGQTCSNDTDCIAPNTCVNGSCGPKPIGASCANPNQCQSGFCSQGVCCNESCDGVQCKSCSLSGSKGTCSLVAAGTTDPAGKCVNSNTTCGTKGTCNANGSCAVTASGVQCGAATCASATSLTPVSTCNGAGACSTPAAQGCGLYTCAGGACKVSCLADSDCADSVNNFCSGSACVAKKTNGTPATTGNQCKSGNVVDGVCCASSSCPGEMCPVSGATYTPAQKCNLNGSGTCSATATTCGAPLTCGTNNRCKTFAIYDSSNYSDENAVYAN